MTDPSDVELAALAAASQAGGEYVESIGKMELASWSAHEWATLVEVIVTAFQNSLRAAADDLPL